MIDAGKLDRKLELQAAGTSKTISGTSQDEFGQVTTDALGQEALSFEPIAVLWAERLEVRTQDAARAGQRDTYTTARYRIRWRDNIATSMRIATGGRLYNIVAIDEPDRRASLVITVEEVMR